MVPSSGLAGCFPVSPPCGHRGTPGRTLGSGFGDHPCWRLSTEAFQGLRGGYNGGLLLKR